MRVASKRNSITLFSRSDSCRIDYDLALHASVAETAGMATLKCICAWCVGQKLNRSRLTFYELPTVLFRSENQASGALRRSAIGNCGNFETVIVVGGRNLELNFGAGLNMNW